jgi:hypothetical protein
MVKNYILSHQGNANQNYAEIPSHPSQIGHHEENRKQTTNVGEDSGKRNTHTLLVGNVN